MAPKKINNTPQKHNMNLRSRNRNNIGTNTPAPPRPQSNRRQQQRAQSRPTPAPQHNAPTTRYSIMRQNVTNVINSESRDRRNRGRRRNVEVSMQQRINMCSNQSINVRLQIIRDLVNDASLDPDELRGLTREQIREVFGSLNNTQFPAYLIYLAVENDMEDIITRIFNEFPDSYNLLHIVMTRIRRDRRELRRRVTEWFDGPSSSNTSRNVSAFTRHIESVRQSGKERMMSRDFPEEEIDRFIAHHPNDRQAVEDFLSSYTNRFYVPKTSQTLDNAFLKYQMGNLRKRGGEDATSQKEEEKEEEEEEMDQLDTDSEEGGDDC